MRRTTENHPGRAMLKTPFDRKVVMEYIVETAVQNGWDTAKENGYLKYHKDGTVAWSPEWIKAEQAAAAFAKEFAIGTIETAIQCAQERFGYSHLKFWSRLSDKHNQETLTELVSRHFR